MVNIKRQKIKAYILLESLIALGLLAVIASTVLGAINKNQQSMKENLRQQEMIDVATMAVQTGQNHLSINGVDVEVVRKDDSIYVYAGQKEVLHIEKD